MDKLEINSNKMKGKDIFGLLKGKLKRSTEDILKEVDEDFEYK